MHLGAECAVALAALVVVILLNITGYALVDEANQQRILLRRQLTAQRNRSEAYRSQIISRTSESAVEAWAKEHGMVRLVDQYRYVGQGQQTALAQPEGR